MDRQFRRHGTHLSIGAYRGRANHLGAAPTSRITPSPRPMCRNSAAKSRATGTTRRLFVPPPRVHHHQCFATSVCSCERPLSGIRRRDHERQELAVQRSRRLSAPRAPLQVPNPGTRFPEQRARHFARRSGHEPVSAWHPGLETIRAWPAITGQHRPHIKFVDSGGSMALSN